MKLNLQFKDPKSKPDIQGIIKNNLKLPSNYSARITSQIKRHAESKTTDELKEHLKDDWKANTQILTDFFSQIEEVQAQLTDYFYSNQSKLRDYILYMEDEISQINYTHKQACNTAFHEYKKSLIKDYIDLGISPDKAVDIVMKTDSTADEIAIEELFKKALSNWHDL